MMTMNDWLNEFVDILICWAPLRTGEQIHAITPIWSLALPLLILRASLGICFVVHGLGKLGLVGTGNMQGFTAWLQSLGVPYPKVQARMAMLTEIIGGLMLTLGLLTRVSCVFLFFTMTIAAFLGHKGAGYLITNNPPGREYALNLAIMMVVLFILGPGMWSLDLVLFSNL